MASGKKITPDMFWADVDKTEDCWLWKGKLSPCGYGMACMRFVPGKPPEQVAHRISYMLVKGPIPQGLELDHLCRIRNCVKPAHLEPVTTMINNRRRPPERRNRKLDPEKVQNIRTKYAAGGITYAELAMAFGVSKTLICKVVRTDWPAPYTSEGRPRRPQVRRKKEEQNG